MQGEPGLPDGGIGRAAQDVLVGLAGAVVEADAAVLEALVALGQPGGAELGVVGPGVHVRPAVEAAVGPNAVAVANRHPAACRTGHPQPGPPGQVLAEVVDGHGLATGPVVVASAEVGPGFVAAYGLGNSPALRWNRPGRASPGFVVASGLGARRRDRVEGPHHPDGRQRLGPQRPRGCRRRASRGPGGVVEAGLGPARLLQAGVVGLAVAVVVVCDRPGRGRPGAVAGHPHPLAAAQFNGELQQADGGGPVGLAVAGRRGHVVLGAVPAVAEHEPHRVAAGPQEAGHVVGGVEHPRAQLEGLVVVVVGGGRVQRLVADPAAVDVQLVVPEPGDVAPGPLRRTGQPELLAQQRRGHGRVGADPRRGPVPRRQQRHLEDGRGAVGAPAAVAVPDLHLPPAPLAAAQRGPGVGDADGVVGGHPARVPFVARPGIQDAGS